MGVVDVLMLQFTNVIMRVRHFAAQYTGGVETPQNIAIILELITEKVRNYFLFPLCRDYSQSSAL